MTDTCLAVVLDGTGTDAVRSGLVHATTVSARGS
jgi:hypothetical protein